MEGNYTRDESGLRIKFCGEKEINAKTLSIALQGVVEVIESITKETYSEAYAKLSIKETEPSSFMLLFSVLISTNAPLFATTANLALETLNIFIEILKIKKHLKGKPPKEITQNNTAITNENNETQNFSGKSVILYLNRPVFDNCTVKMCQALEEDPQRNETEIQPIGEGVGSVTIGKPDYKQMAVPLYEQLPHDIRIDEQDFPGAIVYVKKPDLMGDSQWELYFLEGRIFAEIEDIVWLEKVKHKDVVFWAGAKLRVNMHVITEEQNGARHNRYVIKKIIEVEKEPTQHKLFKKLE